MKHTTRYSSGEFVVGQVFNSKSDLQGLQRFTQLKHTKSCILKKKLLVLKCKKAEGRQCPWKLRVMLVKDTCLFVINKYKGSHTCVNPCFNRYHHQLDSSLVAVHIKAILKARFTLLATIIQASVIEKWGYEISYKKTFDGKHKALRHLFGDFYQSYTKLSCFFLALEQTNLGCIVI